MDIPAEFAHVVATREEVREHLESMKGAVADILADHCKSLLPTVTVLARRTDPTAPTVLKVYLMADGFRGDADKKEKLSWVGRELRRQFLFPVVAGIAYEAWGIIRERREDVSRPSEAPDRRELITVGVSDLTGHKQAMSAMYFTRDEKGGMVAAPWQDSPPDARVEARILGHLFRAFLSP